MDLGADRRECLGGGVGAGQAEDFMSRIGEVGNDGGPDESGRASDEDTHEKPPVVLGAPGSYAP